MHSKLGIARPWWTLQRWVWVGRQSNVLAAKPVSTPVGVETEKERRLDVYGSAETCMAGHGHPRDA